MSSPQGGSRRWSDGSPVAITQNPQTAFWNTLRSPCGLSEACAAAALAVRLRGRESAMVRIASDSAVSSASAASDRRSVYQLAKGTTAPGLSVSSEAAINSVFLVCGLAEEVGSQPAITASPDSQQRHSQVGIQIAARTSFDEGQPAVSEEFLPRRAHLIVGAALGPGLPLAHEPRVQQSLERGDRGALGQTSCLLQLVRGRDLAVDQGQDEQVQVGPAALVTSLRHIAISIRTFELAIEPGSRSHNIPRPADPCVSCQTHYQPAGEPMGILR